MAFSLLCTPSMKRSAQIHQHLTSIALRNLLRDEDDCSEETKSRHQKRIRQMLLESLSHRPPKPALVVEER